MNILEIINKKVHKEELNYEELKYVINGYLNGNIKDYQMSSLLMAILLNDMTSKEIIYLTNLMANSGDKLDLSVLGDNVVDKHSTGGVGDKTTLIIAPLVAACGVKVAKMSGRGLGHTGGTIDKLESIPGFNVNLSEDEFLEEVKKIGLAITSQTKEVAIADKKIYALRDVTGTVESIPLIASSIMSKKIALGAKKLVLDVKVGNGALIKTKEDAIRLSKLMINIGKKNDIDVICLLTNMNIPLGDNIGNSLEVMEAIEILQNKKNNNLRELCISLASYMVMLGKNIDYNDAKNRVLENLLNGNAYYKFLEMIKYQGGDITLLPRSKYVYNIKSNKHGYLTNIDAYKLGVLSMSLGAGRKNKEDKINYGAGIILKKHLHDYIEHGDVLMEVHTDLELSDIDNTIFEISTEDRKPDKLIYEVISAN